jgi:1,4-alpha-glucan branching enzyme
VSLIGEFNQRNRESHPLAPAGRGIWQLRLPGDALAHGQLVKLHIVGADGSRRDRIPACIRRAVQDPITHDYCGQIWSPPHTYVWQHPFDPADIGAPLIYEAHVGIGGEEPRVHTYREFTEHVLPRIAASGYNVIQLMAVQEHPYYGSFGYHVSSFFAPCSRFGTPDDLKHLIDTAHSHGIAVLLDIVHSHAVKNTSEGLNDFDGSGNQYFHAGSRGDHPQWDSKCFDYARPEVRQFLLSNLRYWIEEFHFDGFRFDGVTSMLYHHHGQEAFDHYDKYFGPGSDDDSILYLQLATTLVKSLKPGALLIAEDMSGMPGLCRTVEDGGCGFTHRLAMGIPDHWIKLLKHSRDEDWDLGELWGVLANRRYREATVAYAESHDQALVGDKTLAFWLMDKEMYWHMLQGESHPVIERGIALHKMIRLMTFAIGGEAWLSFMGNEFGHPEWLDFPREGNGWSYHYCRRQWSLADNPNLRYRDLGAFDRAMLDLQNDHHLLESPPAGLIHIDNENRILCCSRGGLVFVFNFSVDRSPFGYPVKCPVPGPLRLILDSDAAQFGGHARADASITYPVSEDGMLSIYAPSRTALVFG